MGKNGVLIESQELWNTVECGLYSTDGRRGSELRVLGAVATEGRLLHRLTHVVLRQTARLVERAALFCKLTRDVARALCADDAVHVRVLLPRSIKRRRID